MVSSGSIVFPSSTIVMSDTPDERMRCHSTPKPTSEQYNAAFDKTDGQRSLLPPLYPSPFTGRLRRVKCSSFLNSAQPRRRESPVPLKSASSSVATGSRCSVTSDSLVLARVLPSETTLSDGSLCQPDPPVRAGRPDAGDGVCPGSSLLLEKIHQCAPCAEDVTVVLDTQQASLPLKGTPFELSSENECKEVRLSRSPATASPVDAGGLLKEVKLLCKDDLDELRTSTTSTGAHVFLPNKVYEASSMGTLPCAPSGETHPSPVFNRASQAESHDGTKLLNDYMLIQELGSGASGKVVLAYSLSRNTPVAIKMVAKTTGSPKLQRRFSFADDSSTPTDTPIEETGLGNRSLHLTRSKRKEMEWQREIRVMQRLHHKNVVALHEVIDDPDSHMVYMVMQFIDKGPVSNIYNNGRLSSTVKPVALLSVACQIAVGLEYLHKMGIVHRDIKPENVLMSSTGEAYLVDFGVAMELEWVDGGVQGVRGEGFPPAKVALEEYVFQGTPLFIAPEVYVRDEDYGRLSWIASEKGKPYVDLYALDVWALGVTLLSLLTGQVPFRSLSDIRRTLWEPVQIPPSVPSWWCMILQQMLQSCPAKRPNISIVREMLEKYSNLYQEDEDIVSGISEVNGMSTQHNTGDNPGISMRLVSDPCLLSTRGGDSHGDDEDRVVIGSTTDYWTERPQGRRWGMVPSADATPVMRMKAGNEEDSILLSAAHINGNDQRRHTHPLAPPPWSRPWSPHYTRLYKVAQRSISPPTSTSSEAPSKSTTDTSIQPSTTDGGKHTQQSSVTTKLLSSPVICPSSKPPLATGYSNRWPDDVKVVQNESGIKNRKASLFINAARKQMYLHEAGTTKKLGR